MTDEVIPWWTPPLPEDASKSQPLTWRDWWDALLGRLETFYKVEHDGSWFICEAHEVWVYQGTQAHGDTYDITPVQMTRRQYEALPEFTGF